MSGHLLWVLFTALLWSGGDDQEPCGGAGVREYLSDKWLKSCQAPKAKYGTAPKTLYSYVSTSSRITWHLPNKHEGNRSSNEQMWQMQLHGYQKHGSFASKTTLLRPTGHTKLQSNWPTWNITSMVHAFQYLSYPRLNLYTFLGSQTHITQTKEI